MWYNKCVHSEDNVTSPNEEQTNIPLESMTGKVSHVKQYLAEQEKKSKVKPHILPNRTHRSNSLDRRDSVDSNLNSNFSKVTKDLATFKNGKGGSLLMSDVYFILIFWKFNLIYSSNIMITNIFTKNQFSYVKQYLLEQEEADKLEKVSIQHQNIHLLHSYWYTL